MLPDPPAGFTLQGPPAGSEYVEPTPPDNEPTPENEPTNGPDLSSAAQPTEQRPSSEKSSTSARESQSSVTKASTTRETKSASTSRPSCTSRQELPPLPSEGLYEDEDSIVVATQLDDISHGSDGVIIVPTFYALLSFKGKMAYLQRFGKHVYDTKLRYDNGNPAAVALNNAHLPNIIKIEGGEITSLAGYTTGKLAELDRKQQSGKKLGKHDKLWVRRWKDFAKSLDKEKSMERKFLDIELPIYRQQLGLDCGDDKPRPPPADPEPLLSIIATPASTSQTSCTARVPIASEPAGQFYTEEESMALADILEDLLTNGDYSHYTVPEGYESMTLRGKMLYLFRFDAHFWSEKLHHLDGTPAAVNHHNVLLPNGVSVDEKANVFLYEGKTLHEIAESPNAERLLEEWGKIQDEMDEAWKVEKRFGKMPIRNENFCVGPSESKAEKDRKAKARAKELAEWKEKSHKADAEGEAKEFQAEWEEERQRQEEWDRQSRDKAHDEAKKKAEDEARKKAQEELKKKEEAAQEELRKKEEEAREKEKEWEKVREKETQCHGVFGWVC